MTEFTVSAATRRRRPDVLLFDRGRPVLAIEVLHSHEVSREKAIDFAYMDLPWLEIRADPSLIAPETAWNLDQPLRYVQRHPNPPWTCELHMWLRTQHELKERIARLDGTQRSAMRTLSAARQRTAALRTQREAIARRRAGRVQADTHFRSALEEAFADPERAYQGCCALVARDPALARQLPVSGPEAVGKLRPTLRPEWWARLIGLNTTVPARAARLRAVHALEDLLSLCGSFALSEDSEDSLVTAANQRDGTVLDSINAALTAAAHNEAEAQVSLDSVQHELILLKRDRADAARQIVRVRGTSP